MKRPLALLACILIIGVATGCSSASKSEPAPAPSPSPASGPAPAPKVSEPHGPRLGSAPWPIPREQKIPWDDPEAMNALQGLDGKTQAKTSITWPAEDQVLESGTGTVQFGVVNFDEFSGRYSYTALVLDNLAPVIDHDRTTTLEALNGGKPLAEGTHLLTVIPVRACGLSLKNEGACAQVRFHVKKKSGEVPGAKDLQIILLEPAGGTLSKTSEAAKHVACDFYLLNADMDKEHFLKTLDVVVRVKHPDGHVEKIKSTSWRPLILMNDPKPGKYLVTLSMEERDDGDPVDGPFMETTRELTIESP